jgi:digeranylgeranylglycerophospholipid reductase
MKPNIETDILVCGLGPAGAMAARAAARAGMKVIAVERNAEPGKPVQCAEFVPMMIGTEMPEVAAMRVQEIDCMLTYVGTDKADLTPDFPGYMIDRARFDAELVSQAQKAGAECWYSSPLRTVTANGIAVMADGTTISARVIVAADGPRSPVGRATGIVNRDLVESRQIGVDLLVPHDGTDIFLHPDIVGGYAWLFPKGERCNLGIGVVASEKHFLKPLLDNLHQMLVRQGRVGAAIHSHTGGPIPVGGILPLHTQVGDTSVLFCGDAAGLANPVTGAGINSAVISGKLAGEAAVGLVCGDSDAAADYEDEVQALFGNSIGLAQRRRRELLKNYENRGVPAPKQLRDSWIAYPQYWRSENTAPTGKTGNNSEKARNFA